MLRQNKHICALKFPSQEAVNQFMANVWTPPIQDYITTAWQPDVPVPSLPPTQAAIVPLEFD